MKPRSSRFSPRLLEPELLEQLTVGREQLLTRLVGKLSAAIVHGQGRFDLLVGPRGVGKSHLLGLVEARVRASEALRGRVVVVSLAEEFHPSSLLHLLAKVLEGLAEEPPVSEHVAQNPQPQLAAQLAALRGRDTSEAIDMAVAMIAPAHHLVGGSPRVVALVFHHLDLERLDDLEANFFSLAEEVTPYFQEQMTRLSAGQRLRLRRSRRVFMVRRRAYRRICARCGAIDWCTRSPWGRSGFMRSRIRCIGSRGR